MTDHYVLACVAIYIAFATFSPAAPDPAEPATPPHEIPPEDIDKSG
jgi:hypothetical protein